MDLKGFTLIWFFIQCLDYGFGFPGRIIDSSGFQLKKFEVLLDVDLMDLKKPTYTGSVFIELLLKTNLKSITINCHRDVDIMNAVVKREDEKNIYCKTIHSYEYLTEGFFCSYEGQERGVQLQSRYGETLVREESREGSIRATNRVQGKSGNEELERTLPHPPWRHLHPINQILHSLRQKCHPLLR